MIDSRRNRQSSSKASRREAIEREKRRREESLAVPVDKQIFVLNEHFSDDGGPCGFWTKEFRDDDADRFDTYAWRSSVESAPDGWVPPEIVRNDDPEFPTDRGLGDYGQFAGLMIFSARAAKALRHLLQPCGLFLPVRCAEGEFVGYRLDAAVEALDFDRTSADWRLFPGRDKHESASSISRYAFHTSRLGPATIFRVPQHYAVLVLKEFVDVVRSNPFSGFRFCRVWPNWTGGPWWQEKENWC